MYSISCLLRPLSAYFCAEAGKEEKNEMKHWDPIVCLPFWISCRNSLFMIITPKYKVHFESIELSALSSLFIF